MYIIKKQSRSIELIAGWVLLIRKNLLDLFLLLTTIAFFSKLVQWALFTLHSDNFRRSGLMSSFQDSSVCLSYPGLRFAATWAMIIKKFRENAILDT